MMNPKEILDGARTFVTFDPRDMVRELRAYGEDEAAERIRFLDAESIRAIGVLASRQKILDNPMLDTKICLGVVEFLEGKPRPLRRKRRFYPKADSTSPNNSLKRTNQSLRD